MGTRRKDEVDRQQPGDWPAGAYEAFLKAMEIAEARGDFERQAELEAVINTGRRVREPFAKENEDRRRRSADNIAAWQKTAAALWGMPLHRHKNASDIARLIDPGRWDYIRRFLRKPQK